MCAMRAFVTPGWVSQFLASSAAQLRYMQGVGRLLGTWQGEATTAACHAHQTLTRQLECAKLGSKLSWFI